MTSSDQQRNSPAPSATAAGTDGNPHAPWPRIAVYGAGAVGCYFGALLAEAGAPVTLIGRAAHVEAMRREGLLFDSPGAIRRIRIAADTSPAAIHEAQLVLVCVKTRDTADAARTLAPLLGAGAIVASMQNGVDNVPRMREAAGIDALGVAVYVAASMPAPGHLLHAGRGDLVIGEFGAQRVSTRAQMLAGWFERAGVPCRLEADVRGELWAKLVMNCAFNAISALTRSRYGAMIADAGTRALMREAIAECVAVAQADAVSIQDSDAQYEAALRLGEAMTLASSSMNQDLAQRRLTEIDSINGYVVQRGAALGVPTPVNRALSTMVRLREQNRD